MEYKVAVIGLGYVGLPLAVEAGKHYSTIGFDINTTRIAELTKGKDKTHEVTAEDLLSAKNLTFTAKSDDLKNANFFIVTVPTPVDEYKKPDLRPLESASKTIAPYLKEGDIVVYESTVFPGCTEEICVPILEAGSGLKFNVDFFAGYSPERINPGDKIHNLTTIKKVTSGSTPEIAKVVDHFYSSFISAGTYLASSIQVAEAAKVIENAQRDINIAFVNELSVIFEKMGIDTSEVLEAAGTKWNFLKFKPGLVGGHCIGVDPYYLTHKAEMLGYQPQVILAGRRINDGMGKFIAEKTVKLMIKQGANVKGAKVSLLGLTFKEDCSDLRNSKAIDVIRELEDFGCDVSVCDPLADPVKAMQEYGVTLLPMEELPKEASVVILAVAHEVFRKMPMEQLLSSLKQPNGLVVDVKACLPVSAMQNALWRL